MNLISIDSISKSLGDKLLFENVSFGINSGEKTALIGNNGTGKTTLLKILAASEEADKGAISTNNDLRISYLQQLPAYNEEDTIIEHILSDDSPVMNLIRQYEACLEELNRGDSPEIQKRLARLIEQMDHEKAWDIESEIKSVLHELGITEPLLKMNELSGGMLKKADLARVLLRDSNLILLDEPTNHLDIATICWLQDYLIKTRKAVILVTHDRYFLENICKFILEIDDMKLSRYNGNYSFYLEKKAEILHSKSKAQERIETILKREVAWLKRGAKARTGKSKARKDRVMNLMNQKENLTVQTAEFSVSHRRLGKKIMEIKNITKAYGENEVLKTFSYSFKRGERIGLVGPNGSGKSTFLKILTGNLEPDSGALDKGLNTHFGYFDQLSDPLNQDLTILEYLKETADYITLGDGSTMGVSILLEYFSFNRDKFNTKLMYLSGGERRRLYLINVLLESPNFLVLDEPTNDFDIKTLSMLEDFVSNFPGCFVIVSHDRYFLDRTVDYLFIFDGKGNILGFGGNYSQYLEYLEELKKEEAAVKATKIPQKVRTEPEKRKLTFKEKKEYEEIFMEIETLEEEKESLEALFASPDLAPEKLKESQKRYNIIEETLLEKMTRWEELGKWAE